MSKLAKIFDVLRKANDPIVGTSLAAAISTADPIAQVEIVKVLLENKNEASRNHLITHFHELEKQALQIVVAQADRLDGALRIAGSESPQCRLNVIELIRQAESYRLAYLLAHQLKCSEGRIAKAAAEALLSLAQRLVAHRDTWDEQTHEKHLNWMDNALQDACAGYRQHGRREILRAAALLMPAYPPQTMKQLSHPKCLAASAMRDELPKNDYAEIDDGFLCMAGIETLKPGVFESLRQGRFHHRLPRILRQGHLLAATPIARTFQVVAHPQQLLPKADAIEAMDVAAAMQLPRWTAALNISDDLKAEAMRPLTMSSNPRLRLSALRMLVRLPCELADEIIVPLCLDREESIAMIALRHLIARDWGGVSRLLVRLVSSDHPRVRQLAEQRVGPVGFQRLWEHWENLDPARRIKAGQGLIKLDPLFAKHLVEYTRSTVRDERLQAVLMARSLDLEGDMEAELMRLAHDPDARVLSAVAAALGKVTLSKEAPFELVRLLAHSNDRVRSNAIESLELLGKARFATKPLMQIAKESGNRSRATAIHTLLKLEFPQAMESLETMLMEESPEHRISALWVIENLAVPEVAQIVATLATGDANANVRKRALCVLRNVAHREPRDKDKGKEKQSA